jgi:hypothetical protein
MQFGDDWKAVATEMGFKNKKEAILEFLRVNFDLEFGSKFLADFT